MPRICPPGSKDDNVNTRETRLVFFSRILRDLFLSKSFLTTFRLTSSTNLKTRLLFSPKKDKKYLRNPVTILVEQLTASEVTLLSCDHDGVALPLYVLVTSMGNPTLSVL